MRASDDDRDLVAERLYNATVEGRLLTAELDQRLGLALSARTYGELEPLVADLPGGRPGPRAGGFPAGGFRAGGSRAGGSRAGGSRAGGSPIRLRALATLAVMILLIVLGAIAWQRS